MTHALVRAARVARTRSRDGDLCFFCGHAMVFERRPGMTDKGWACHPARETVEHLVRRTDGGGSRGQNLRLAHRKCNNDASPMTHLEKEVIVAYWNRYWGGEGRFRGTTNSPPLAPITLVWGYVVDPGAMFGWKRL